jgi:hypothetical protein
MIEFFIEWSLLLGDHKGGRLLDVVAFRNDLAIPKVDVIDVGFSDHQLVRWTSDLSKPAPVYKTST